MKQIVSSELHDSRVTSLEKKIKRSISDIPIELRYRLFGDFFTYKHPQKRINTVAHDCNSFFSLSTDLQRMVRGNPASGVLASAIRCNYSKSNKNLIRFLLDEIHIQKVRQQQLHIIWTFLWKDIFGFIQFKNKYTDGNDRYAWEDCVRDAIIVFPASIPKLEVERWMGGTEYVILSILRSKGISAPKDKLIRRASTDPSHPLYGNIGEVVERVENYHSLGRDLRRQLLVELLEENGCQLRRESAICNNWIYGSVVCDVEEVVAVAIVSKALFRNFEFSPVGKTFKAETLLNLVKSDGFASDSWIKNAKDIVKTPDFIECNIWPWDFEKEYDDWWK